MSETKTETVTVPHYKIINEDALSDEFFARAQTLFTQYGGSADLLSAIMGGLTVAIAKVLVAYTDNPRELSEQVVSNILQQRIDFYTENMERKGNEY